MSNGEVPASHITSGDSVFFEGAIRVVRARIDVAHPRRVLLQTEDHRSISLSPETLIERLDSGVAVGSYLGPRWVCGMPEKTEVSSLDSGDFVIEPDAEIVLAAISTPNGVVLVTAELRDRNQVHIRLYDHGSRIRLLARGLRVDPWSGPRISTKSAVECTYSDLDAPSEIVTEFGVTAVIAATRSGSNVHLKTRDGSELVHAADDPCIRLIDSPEPEPTPINTETSGKPAMSPPVERFCGNCGRPRKAGSVFCTGCGNKFSRLDTTGFNP